MDVCERQSVTTGVLVQNRERERYNMSMCGVWMHVCAKPRERYMYMFVQSVTACVFECGRACCLFSPTYHLT